jgi:branched-chain amino acid transport system ATP-binding protein
VAPSISVADPQGGAVTAQIAEPILKLQGIGRTFGSLDVLAGVDLDVQAGVRHLIIGPNGAGKTTLFNVVTGQLSPSSGSVEFAGENVTSMPSHRRARLGMGRTFQIASLFQQLSVWDNLVLAASAPGVMRTIARDARDRAERALIECGLEDRRNVVVALLSYGEQRRLEIALTLTGRPRMLFLDEPMAGLTQEERLVLAKRIVDLSKSITILLIEHDLEVALTVAERLTVLNLGRILRDGAPAEVIADAEVRRIYLG